MITKPPIALQTTNTLTPRWLVLTRTVPSESVALLDMLLMVLPPLICTIVHTLLAHAGDATRLASYQVTISEMHYIALCKSANAARALDCPSTPGIGGARKDGLRLKPAGD